MVMACSPIQKAASRKTANGLKACFQEAEKPGGPIMLDVSLSGDDSDDYYYLDIIWKEQTT